MDSLAPSESLIGSNTSAISISELATCTKRPEQVLGAALFFACANDGSRRSHPGNADQRQDVCRR
ncbi:MAG: hypothetical protein KAR15_07285 [Desulfobacterales bacterium]|nr:hypothetical protein [Desulfobacterales bacterium]